MGDIRLDPATLRTLEAYHYGEAADWYASGECRAVAEWHQREYERLRDLADKAEARPPLLSDWFAAGSASRVGTPPNTHHSAQTILVMSWPFECHRIAVWKNRAEITWKGQPAGTAATPAELRAALDRLAAEPRP